MIDMSAMSSTRALPAGSITRWLAVTPAVTAWGARSTRARLASLTFTCATLTAVAACRSLAATRPEAGMPSPGACTGRIGAKPGILLFARRFWPDVHRVPPARWGRYLTLTLTTRKPVLRLYWVVNVSGV